MSFIFRRRILEARKPPPRETAIRALCLAMAIALASFAGNGCASDREAEVESDADAAHAECLVCKSEGDLACVRVTVEADTPRAELDGVTYYFCSMQCRDDFLRDPERYLKR